MPQSSRTFRIFVSSTFTIAGDWRPIAKAWQKNDNEIIHDGEQ